MTNILPLSRCPHCGARGALKNEPLRVDGFAINDPYCGVCGKNWPQDALRQPESDSRVRPFSGESGSMSGCEPLGKPQ